jgi:hypothetical protein
MTMITTISMDNRIEFNIDNGLDQDLLRYCENICMRECNSAFDPRCGDCHVTRLYFAMVRLAEYESVGPPPIKDSGQRRIMGLNYDELPSRGKATSDGEKTKNHNACGGPCYVHYDENRVYRVECVKCGNLVTFKASSLDLAIKIWNDMPDTIE